MSAKFEYTEKDMKEYMDKKIHQNKVNFDQLVKNMKPIVMKEALDFVKQQTQVVVKLLTKAHHGMIKDMLSYRASN